MSFRIKRPTPTSPQTCPGIRDFIRPTMTYVKCHVCGGDMEIWSDEDVGVTVVSKLVRDIPNLRPLRVGPLENSKWIESITPLLLNAAILNGLHDPSIRVVPWMPTSYET